MENKDYCQPLSAGGYVVNPFGIWTHCMENKGYCQPLSAVSYVVNPLLQYDQSADGFQ